ncbi:tryptophan synthase beta subunit-like PLP-dependent enzyme [Glonium stellatum]|uniref:L-serine ammonia-lyase n=1 Tax=Glonium stellatum TaxID=574774 RepID=A0A8E2K051_9PEZI|nr:tryptophan synthase beta subunit-like PLP-dependent enzyme [Glonium stellatum]
MAVQNGGSILSQKQEKPWVQTPLKESSSLSRAANCRVFLKLENLQPSGSFKSRGIGNYLLARLSSNPSSTPHIYSSSGGNAGLACVYAARTLHHPCTVVVPLSTKPMMISKLRAAGAHDVIQHGATWAEADKYLREEVLGKDNKGIYVPPFDHPDIWTGNATIMHEIKEQMPHGEKPDVVICSVGGGGLFNGVCEGLDALGWSDVQVLAMETKGAESLAKSISARELVTLPGITSQATSLGAVRVTGKSLEYGLRPNVKSVMLPDAEAAMGCWRLADDERLMVEMASGVNVALCYDGRLEKVLGRKLGKESKVVIVLCGGSNVTVDMLMRWRQEFGTVEVEMPINGEVPSQKSAPSAMLSH